MDPIRVGSICVEESGGGNMQIYHSHTPSNSITVERADYSDLLEAITRYLDRAMNEPCVASHLRRIKF